MKTNNFINHDIKYDKIKYNIKVNIMILSYTFKQKRLGQMTSGVMMNKRFLLLELLTIVYK